MYCCESIEDPCSPSSAARRPLQAIAACPELAEAEDGQACGERTHCAFSRVGLEREVRVFAFQVNMLCLFCSSLRKKLSIILKGSSQTGLLQFC